jgi:hypothetical protein
VEKCKEKNGGTENRNFSVSPKNTLTISEHQNHMRGKFRNEDEISFPKAVITSAAKQFRRDKHCVGPNEIASLRSQ